MIDKRMKKKLQGRFGKYNFEVGILDDGPHKVAMTGEAGKGGGDVVSNYAGGFVRKKSRKSSGTISEVSKANRERLGINFYKEPFERKNSEIMKFTKAFFKLAFGKTEKKRAENLLQAVVRNPILRGDYGSNSGLTIMIKGFDRHMIDTGQMFKAIKARCTIKKGGWFG